MFTLNTGEFFSFLFFVFGENILLLLYFVYLCVSFKLHERVARKELSKFQGGVKLGKIVSLKDSCVIRRLIDEVLEKFYLVMSVCFMLQLVSW